MNQNIIRTSTADLYDAHVMKNYARAPLTLVRGRGAQVWDDQGRAFLDFTSGIAVSALGHCHPALVRALEEQSRTLWHASNHYYIPRQIELAEALLAVTPFARRAFFCNSGTEGIEAALKFARLEGHPRAGRHATNPGASQR